MKRNSLSIPSASLFRVSELRDFLTYIYKRILSPLNNDLTGFTLLCSLVALANLTVAKCHQSLIEGCAGLRGLLTYSRSFRSHS